METMTMSRRNFVKLSALTAAVAGIGVETVGNLVPSTKAYADSTITYQQTNCAACISNCSVIASIQNGRIIKLEGDSRDPLNKGRVCPKGLAGIGAVYHPNRTKYPMKRVGERGVDNTWQRITWDEGITLVAQALVEMRDKEGRRGLFCTTGGGGNPNFFAPQQFRNMWGAGNVCEPGCAQCYLPREWAMPYVNGMGNTSLADGSCAEFYRHDIGNYNGCYVMWGSGPAQHAPSTMGRAAVEVREAGCKSVVIDPRFTPDAARADVWLPIKPETDLCLMLAWIKWIIDNKKYDEDVTVNFTNLPFLVDPNDPAGLLLRSNLVKGMEEEAVGYVYYDKVEKAVKKAFKLGPENEASYNPVCFGEEGNGIEVELADGTTVTTMTAGYAYMKAIEKYTITYAAEECCLDADDIVKALTLYTDAPTGGISLGVATDQNQNSVQAPQAIAALDVLTGKVSKPGAMVKARGGMPGGGGMPGMMGGGGATAEENPNGKKVSKYTGAGGMIGSYNMTEESIRERLGYIEYKGFTSWQHSHIPTVLEAALTGKPYQPTVWIERSGNKMAMFGNSSSWTKAIPKFSFILHSYMYPTSFTFEAADVILPITEWLESATGTVSREYYSGIRCDCTLLFEHCDDRFTWYTIIKKLADLGDENAKLAWSWDVQYANFEWKRYLASLTSTDNADDWEATKQSYPKLSYDSDEAYWAAQTYSSYRTLSGEYYSGISGCAAADIQDAPLKAGIYCDFFTYFGRHGSESFDLGPASSDYMPIPHYDRPYEYDLSDKDKYPYPITSGRVMYFHHGTLRNSPYMRELYPAPEIWIYPDIAEAKGIKSGDWVNIKSRRCDEAYTDDFANKDIIKDGIYAVAYVTPGIAKNALYLERFWNPEFLDYEDQNARKSWTVSNINVITKNDPPYNREIGSYTLRGFAVNIEKAEKPEGVWYSPTDFKPWLPNPTENTGGGYVCGTLSS